jgi:ribosome maturation factor RimP
MLRESRKHDGLLEKFRKRITPSIEELGYKLYSIEELQSEGNRILRVSIDHPRGIQIEDCVRVDQILQKLMGDEDPIEESYMLEISSPGIFRKLIEPEHFQRFCGDRIYVRLKNKINGLKQSVGILKSVSEDGILFVPEKNSEEELFFAYKNIGKARLEPELI